MHTYNPHTHPYTRAQIFTNILVQIYVQGALQPPEITFPASATDLEDYTLTKSGLYYQWVKVTHAHAHTHTHQVWSLLPVGQGDTHTHTHTHT